MILTKEELKEIRKKQRRKNKKAGPIPPKLLHREQFIKVHSKHLDQQSDRHLNDWNEFKKTVMKTKQWLHIDLLCSCGQSVSYSKRRRK